MPNAAEHGMPNAPSYMAEHHGHGAEHQTQMRAPSGVPQYPHVPADQNVQAQFASAGLYPTVNADAVYPPPPPAASVAPIQSASASHAQANPLASLFPPDMDHQYIFNGKTSRTPNHQNVYPLSKAQLTYYMLDQDQMADRFSYIHKYGWHNALQQLKATQFLNFFTLDLQTGFFKLKSRETILHDTFTSAIGVVLNNDETDLMEVLVTARNEEKNEQTFNWRKLIDGIGRNRYRALLEALCTRPRDTSFDVDYELAQAIAYFFNGYFQKYYKYEGRENDEYQKDPRERDYAIATLALTNYSQLRLICECYHNKYKVPLYNTIWQRIDPKKKDQRFYKAALRIIDDACNGRVEFFAGLLHEKMDKLKKTILHPDSHKDVQRILLLRFQIDLGEIVMAYNQRAMRNGKPTLKNAFLALQEEQQQYGECGDDEHWS